MYTKGHNKVFFQSNLDGESVKIEFINPKAEKSKRFQMTYIDDGLYYVDIWLKYYGAYCIRAYNTSNERVGHGIISVGIGGNIVYPDLDRVV